MGVDPQAIPHVDLASKAGLGPLGIEEIVINGESLESVRRPFELPVYETSPCEGMCVFEGVACSGCTGHVALALRDLKESGELVGIAEAIGRVNIIHGEDAPVPDSQLEGTCLYLGKCQRKSRDLGTWVPGCPAHVAIIEDALRQLAGLPVRDPAWSAVKDDVKRPKVAGATPGRIWARTALSHAIQAECPSFASSRVQALDNQLRAVTTCLRFGFAARSGRLRVKQEAVSELHGIPAQLRDL